MLAWKKSIYFDHWPCSDVQIQSGTKKLKIVCSKTFSLVKVVPNDWYGATTALGLFQLILVVRINYEPLDNRSR